MLAVGVLRVNDVMLSEKTITNTSLSDERNTYMEDKISTLKYGGNDFGSYAVNTVLYGLMLDTIGEIIYIFAFSEDY